MFGVVVFYTGMRAPINPRHNDINTNMEDGYSYSYISTGSQCLLGMLRNSFAFSFFIIQKSAKRLHVSHSAGNSQWAALVCGIREPTRPD